MHAIGTLCRWSKQGSTESLIVKILQDRYNESEKCQEYYIHVDGNDPRLDEWVSKESLSDCTENRTTVATLSSHHKRIKHQDSDDKLPVTGEKKIWHHGGGHGEAHTKVRNVDKIFIGKHVIDCWYYSPYPFDHIDTLYVCTETFKYMRSPRVFLEHVRTLRERYPQVLPPPGVLVYHDPNVLSVYRVEGSLQKLYCQNLCLLGKLFLDHKTLYFDPSHFYFYVLVEHPSFEFVGYFSKEKESTYDYNLACILSLPPFQRKGYGKFIISFSYELSKREGKQQTPEKPLSDLGKLSYRAYWSCVLLQVLLHACRDGKRPTMNDISKETGIKLEDTISTLQSLGCVKFYKRCFVLAVSLQQIELLFKPFEERNFSLRFCKPACFLE